MNPVLVRIAVCLALAVRFTTAPASAATGVPAWEQTFRKGLAGSGSQYPLAARELADGTRMVVVSDNGAFSAVRHGADGAVLSAAAFYPANVTTVDPLQYFSGYTTPAVVAIDPFGSVFVGAISGLSSAPFFSRGNAWFAKFDGVTGRALWPAPATWVSPSGLLSAPRTLFVDDRGDLVASLLVRANSGSSVDQVGLKLDGATGALAWGPAILPSVNSSVASLDAAGNLLVAVGVYGNSSTKIRAAKYAAGNGALAWGPVDFDSPAEESVRAAAAGADGAFVVAGGFVSNGTRGLQAVKFDGLTGSVVWGPARWTAPEGTTEAYATAVDVSATGDVFACGDVRNGTPSRALIALSRASGDLLWGPVALEGGGSEPATLATAGNGDVVVASRAYGPGPSLQLQVSRFRGANGTAVWGPFSDTVGGNFLLAPVAILTSDGGVFVADSDPAAQPSDAFAMERALSTGSVAWGPVAFTGAAGGPAQLNDIASGPDGNVVVTGHVTNGNGTYSWATLKYDAATGAVLWGPVLFDTEGYGSDSPWQVLTDSAGDVIVAGYAYFDPEGTRLVVLKYGGADGQLLWTYGIVSDFFPHGLAVDSAGNPVVLGQVYSSTGYDAALVKLSSKTGEALWGPVLIDVGPEDYPSNVVVDAANDPIVSGASYDPFTGTEDWFTLKVAASTGATVWGPVLYTGVYQAPSRAVLDPSGDVVIVGTSEDQMMTIKYDGSTGALLWGPVFYDSPLHYAGGLWAAVDAAGDVFASGISWSAFGNGSNAAFVTIKYSGTDGSVLWGPALHEGPDDAYDLVYGVELDAAGNPVVSGDTETSPNEYRIATLKYDGATGDVLWGPVLTWPASATTDLNGLLVRDGRVFLGGTSQREYRTMVLTESLGIATEAGEFTPISCGDPVAVSLVAENGAPAYAWSLASGSLPAGLSLSADGSFAGAAQEDGVFAFRAQVEDALSATAARDFTLVVGHGPFVPVVAKSDGACHLTLSVEGSWSGYEWLPGGETTSSIVVSPAETTTYGVRLSDGSGCVRHGSITVLATALADPGCLAPSLASVAPDSGPASGGTAITLAGGNFQNGASVAIGAAAAADVTWNGPTEIAATTPVLSPGTVSDVLLQNPDGGYAVLHSAWTTDFLDVPAADPFHDYILTVLREGISSGCSGGNYCPLAPVTRAQMAVFLIKAKFGGDYAPPAASGTVFLDVPADAFGAAYIEQLAALGVTGGCGGGNYCPDGFVTRAQMAVFLLKASLGEKYTPPPATGIFGDVPVGSFADAWIEDLYARAITGGCSAVPLLYCPNASNTRGQMAVFLVKAFGL